MDWMDENVLTWLLLACHVVVICVEMKSGRERSKSVYMVARELRFDSPRTTRLSVVLVLVFGVDKLSVIGLVASNPLFNRYSTGSLVQLAIMFARLCNAPRPQQDTSPC
jgi:hypothetical protein